MNNEVINLLRKEQDFVRYNQNIKKNEREEKIKAYAYKAKENTEKFNAIIFDILFEEYRKVMSCEEDNDAIHTIRFNYIGYPDTILELYQKTGNSGMIANHLYACKHGDRSDFYLAIEYNKTHPDNPILFACLDNLDHIEPVILDINEYKKIGIDFYSFINLKLGHNDGIGLYADLKIDEIKKILKEIDISGLNISNLITRDIFDKTRDNMYAMANRKKIIENFNDRCKRNLDTLSLILCKDFIECYHNRQDGEYTSEFEYISEDDKTIEQIGKVELKRLKDYKLCDTNTKICYVGYYKEDDSKKLTYIPVKYRDLINMASELDFEIDINKEANIITISTDEDKFEKLVGKVTEENKKKKVKKSSRQ